MSDAPLTDLVDASVGKRFAALETLPKTLDDEQVQALVEALDHPQNRTRPHQDFLAELYDVLARAKGPTVDEAMVKGLLCEPHFIYLMMRGHLIGRRGTVHRALEIHDALEGERADALPDGSVDKASALERLKEFLTGLDRIYISDDDWHALGEKRRAAFKMTDDFAHKRDD